MQEEDPFLFLMTLSRIFPWTPAQTKFGLESVTYPVIIVSKAGAECQCNSVVGGTEKEKGTAPISSTAELTQSGQPGFFKQSCRGGKVRIGSIISQLIENRHNVYQKSRLTGLSGSQAQKFGQLSAIHLLDYTSLIFLNDRICQLTFSADK